MLKGVGEEESSPVIFLLYIMFLLYLTSYSNFPCSHIALLLILSTSTQRAYFEIKEESHYTIANFDKKSVFS